MSDRVSVASAWPNPLLPARSCGRWSLGLLEKELAAAKPSRGPVVAFWDGDWNRSLVWDGRRFDGSVADLFLSCLADEVPS